MSIFSRFFGKRDEHDDSSVGLIANPDIAEPLSLQMLFREPPRLDSRSLVATLRSFDRAMKKAEAELDGDLGAGGKLFGLAGWGPHIVRIVGFDVPMPAGVVESCVAPAHYPADLKDQARANQAHALLYYGGYDPSPYEQYVALAAVAGALASFGGVVVLNETAHTSFPAAVFTDADGRGSALALIRELPLLFLFCGFVKCEVENAPGVWMRTFGAHCFGLPDFAAHATGHDEGERYFGIFTNVIGYLRESGAKVAAGHTMQIEEEEFLRFRYPRPDERFLRGGPDVLVIELIGRNQISR